MTPKNEDLERLSVVAQKLSSDIGDLNANAALAMEKINKRAKVTRRIVYCMIILGVFNIFLLSIVVNNAEKISNNQQSISVLQQKLGQQELVDRADALCPLYKLFLDFRSDRAAAADPRGPESYNHAFDIIQHGYDALSCESI